jgi:hypothetical protein
MTLPYAPRWNSAARPCPRVIAASADSSSQGHDEACPEPGCKSRALLSEMRLVFGREQELSPADSKMLGCLTSRLDVCPHANKPPATWMSTTAGKWRWLGFYTLHKRSRSRGHGGVQACSGRGASMQRARAPRLRLRSRGLRQEAALPRAPTPSPIRPSYLPPGVPSDPPLLGPQRPPIPAPRPREGPRSDSGPLVAGPGRGPFPGRPGSRSMPGSLMSRARARKLAGCDEALRRRRW